jgi:hypothetical protein
VALRAGMDDAARSREFQPADYTDAGASWAPPFPYENREILLDLHRLTRPVGDFGAEQSAPVAVRSVDEAAGTTDDGDAPPFPLPRSSFAWPVLARGDRVRCLFGPVGAIDHLLIDPETHLAAYLVIRAGQGLSQDTLVPVDWIRSVDQDGVLLDATYEQLVLLPEYAEPESDAEVTSAVQRVLAQLRRQPLEHPPILVRVERGVVRLSGRVETEAERRAAVAAAQEVSGVREVRDELVTDAALERQVAAALAEYPQTRGSGRLPELSGRA